MPRSVWGIIALFFVGMNDSLSIAVRLKTDARAPGVLL